MEWTYGHLQARLHALPRDPAPLYGQLVSKATSILTTPLPLASSLILPFFGGFPATINFLISYLTWASFVATHGHFQVEIGGTLLVRLVCFLGPAISSLIFDASLPAASKKMKAKGKRHMQQTLGRKRLAGIVAVATVNVLLGVALQAVLEHVATRLLHVRSLIKVTAAIPLPWTIIKDVVKAIPIRGTLRHAIHRFWLHTYQTPLKTWHLQWQHSTQLPSALVAAYDHPLNYLLSTWAPVFVPAVIFRYYVLNWHILLAVDSLLGLSIHSGYAVLRSSIIVPGMARRMDAHFEAVSKGSKAGNFGTLRFWDWMCGTSIDSEVDIFDDLHSQAAKHKFQQRIDEAVKGALASINGDKGQGGEQQSLKKASDPALGDGQKNAAEQNGGSQDADPRPGANTDTAAADASAGAGDQADRSNSQRSQRRSARYKA